MQIFVRIKALGRKKDILSPEPYEIPDSVGTLRELLTALAETEVSRYNAKGVDVQLIPWLTAEEVEERSAAGKVGFGRRYSDRQADPRKAAANALQCWEDGLIRVLMNGVELTEADSPLCIPADAEFVFIRLAFLAGRMW